MYSCYILLTVRLSIILGNDQLEAQLLDFTTRLLCSSTCFEHYMLIMRRLNCIDAATDAVSIQFNLLMISIQCSKHVEERNKRVVKSRNCASSWSLPKTCIVCFISCPCFVESQKSLLIKESKYLTPADLLAFPLHQYVTVLLQTNSVRNATGLGYIISYFYVKWNTTPKHSLKYTLLWITGFVNSPHLYPGR